MIREGAAALREMRALTRDTPDLRALMVSGIAATLASGLLNPVMPVYLETRGLDFQRIGFIFTVGSLVPLFLQPVFGALSDRSGRKRLLIGVSLSTSLMVPLLALLRDPLPLAAALAARLMMDRSATPLSSALLGDLSPPAKRASVFGLFASASSLTFVAGLVLSSAATRLLRVPGVFAVSGALFVASALLLFRLSPDRPRPAAGASESPLRMALAGLRAPIAYARKDPSIAALFAYELAFVFGLDLFPVYLPLFAVKLGAPEAAVGPLIAASWLVYGLVQPIGGRISDRRAGRKRHIAFGLYALAASSLLLGLSGFAPKRVALPAMIVAWVLMAVPDGLCRPSASALLVDLAPDDERGRFFGAIGSLGTMANIVAPLVYGFVAQRAGLPAAFFVSAAALLLASFAIRRVREPAAAPPPAPPEAVPAATEVL